MSTKKPSEKKMKAATKAMCGAIPKGLSPHEIVGAVVGLLRDVCEAQNGKPPLVGAVVFWTLAGQDMKIAVDALLTVAGAAYRIEVTKRRGAS